MDGAAAAFPDCFPGGSFDTDAATIAADQEWSTWLRGGYGVCLRVFTEFTCLRKEILATKMKSALASGVDPASLLDEAEQLSALILPFAPWQRPVGTPGQTIDRILAETGLGDDLPFRGLQGI